MFKSPRSNQQTVKKMFCPPTLTRTTFKTTYRSQFEFSTCSEFSARMWQHGRNCLHPLKPYPMASFSPAQQGALQILSTTIPGRFMPRMYIRGCLLLLGGWTQEEVYTGPRDRIMVVWSENLRVPGVQSKCRV